MSGAIFLVNAEGKLDRLAEAPYEAEQVLQGLLANYPDLLAGEQVNPENPRRWLLVRREAGVPAEEGGSGRWSIDHLFLDQDAVPTLVEVKRSTDSRIRREVVGQMLDYAANGIVYWSPDAIRQQFTATLAEKQDADQMIADFSESGDVEGFWQNVKHNLQAGRVRMVFVADFIPQELRRIVEFLNGQMDPAEVIAIEVRQFQGEGVKALVPQVVGQTAAARQSKGVSCAARQWDEPSFFEELSKRKGEPATSAARALLDWAKSREHRGVRIWWGTGKQNGSFLPMVDHDGLKDSTVAVWTNGVVEIQFQHLTRNQDGARPLPFAQEASRRTLRDKLVEIPGVTIPESAINRRPSIPLEILADTDRQQQFIEVLDWIVEQHLGHGSDAG